MAFKREHKTTLVLPTFLITNRWIKRVICAAAFVTALPLSAAPPAIPLAPFTYTQDGTLTGQRYIGQRKNPACVGFLDYLNHPRSNVLFKPDGTLVRETKKFRSVSWEALDKELYRDGFNANTDAAHSNVRTEYLRRYADPEWVLQRTVAHPYENVPKRQQPERWLYRLVRSRPYTRNMEDLASKVELPTLFHFGAEEWLGYADGKPLVSNVTGLYGTTGAKEWLTYAGLTYAVGNSTYGGGKGAVPKFLSVDVHELNVDENGQSFLYWICAFRAKNKE